MSFTITAADGGPLSIPDREWYINTKARCQRMMLDSLSSNARQIYACLEPQSMGYKKELAVVMEGGKERPMIPADICRRTKLSRQDVAHGLAELEEAGLVIRKAADGGALRKGQVLIYSFAVPRSSQATKIVGSAHQQFPEWFPDLTHLKSFISRKKLVITVDEGTARSHLRVVAEIARAYEQIEEDLLAAVKPLCVKREKNGREQNCSRAEGINVVARNQNGSSAEAKTEPVSLYERNERNERNIERRRRNGSSLVESEATKKPVAAVAPKSIASATLPDHTAVYVARELSPLVSMDEHAAQRMVDGCRAVEQSVNGREIVSLAQAKIYAVQGQIKSGTITNLVGFLITEVPKMCAGHQLQEVRELLELKDKRHAEQIAAVVAIWPELSEEERASYSRRYPHLRITITSAATSGSDTS